MSCFCFLPCAFALCTHRVLYLLLVPSVGLLLLPTHRLCFHRSLDLYCLLLQKIAMTRMRIPMTPSSSLPLLLPPWVVCVFALMRFSVILVLVYIQFSDVGPLWDVRFEYDRRRPSSWGDISLPYPCCISSGISALAVRSSCGVVEIFSSEVSCFCVGFLPSGWFLTFYAVSSLSVAHPCPYSFVVRVDCSWWAL